jgi:AcrR family transcriptional regulator
LEWFDMKTLRERNHERTHNLITAAATALFQTLGYDETTMSDIAEHAQVSRATLFNYFPTKGDLLMAIAQGLLGQEIEPRIRAALGAQLGTLDTLRALFTEVEGIIVKYPALTRAMVSEFSRGTGVFGGVQNGQTTGFAGAIYAVIGMGQRRGEVRTDMDAGYLASTVNVLHTAAFIHAEQDPVRYRAACEALLTFLQGGLFG